MTSTLEDYDDGELVFPKADMQLWKTKKKRSQKDTKADTTAVR